MQSVNSCSCHGPVLDPTQDLGIMEKKMESSLMGLHRMSGSAYTSCIAPRLNGPLVWALKIWDPFIPSIYRICTLKSP